jgi:hypothetical protein
MAEMSKVFDEIRWELYMGQGNRERDLGRIRLREG